MFIYLISLVGAIDKCLISSDNSAAGQDRQKTGPYQQHCMSSSAEFPSAAWHRAEGRSRPSRHSSPSPDTCQCTGVQTPPAGLWS